jgi:hypothetical protein
MIEPQFSWNDFFSGTPQTTLSSVEYNSRQNTTAASVHVLNCLFNRITSSSDGGALFFSTSVQYLLIESSSFFSCKTSAIYGGAIYFSNTNSGESVLHKVCGNDCCSTITESSNGQFALIYVNNIASRKNNINYSSIVRCVNENSGSSYIIRLYYGKICCPSLNMSSNKCQHTSGIICDNFKDSSYVMCSLLYSSFADNNAFGQICIFFDTSGAKYEMKCCNVLRNTQVSKTNGIIWTCGNSMIEDSCILENQANYIFFVQTSSYTITLSNCTVDKTSCNQYIIIQNTITKSFIHGLSHISTRNCHFEYDSVGTLSAIPYVPSLTKKEFCYCYTCQRNNILARIGYFFSLDWVFIITFIHPNPFENR